MSLEIMRRIMVMRKFTELFITICKSQTYAILVIAFCSLLLLIFSFTGYRLSTNPRSRLITVERLLEAGTFAHSSPADTTPMEMSADAVMIKGSLYSSKPPLYPVILATEAWPVKLLTGWKFHEHQTFFARFLAFLNQIIPYLLFLFLALRFAIRTTSDRWTLILLMLSLSIGILPFAYTLDINNHTPGSLLLFFSFVILQKLLSGEANGMRSYAGLGILCGLMAMFELPGLLFALFFLGLAATADRKKTIAAAGAFLIPVLFSSYLFYIISGNPLPFYTQEGIYEYAGSFLEADRKIRTFTEPRINYLFHSLFGHHGMFVMSPVLLIGFAGLLSKMFTGGRGGRIMWIGIAICMVTIAGYVVFRTYNYGGWCIGMRWYILFMPLLMFAGLEILAKMAKTWPGRIAVLVLIAMALPHQYQALTDSAFVRSHWEIWLNELLQ